MGPAQSAIDVRMSMARLPRFLQPFLTWLTGLPLPGEAPLFRWTWEGRIASAVAVLILGLWFGMVGWEHSGAAWLLLPSWLLVTGAARWFYIVAGHYAAHGRLTGSPRGDRFVAEFFSTLMLTIPFDAYHRDHTLYHHSKRLGTTEDPDVQFLLKHGFGPGRSFARLWKRLVSTIVSPRYHASYLLERLRQNLVLAPPWRRLAAWTWLLAMPTMVALSGNTLLWLVIWVLPTNVGFQASALLQYLSEHRWLDSTPSGRTRLARLTFGRFLGDPYPASELSHFRRLLTRLRWWFRLLLLHLPARLAVLVGDLPQHDFHHRRLGAWENATFDRAADQSANVPGWPTPYEDRIGSLGSHIAIVFAAWSESAPGAAPTTITSP